MARTFSAASSQSLHNATALTTASPLAFSCWFKPTTVAAAQSLIAISDGSANNYIQMRMQNTGALVGAVVQAAAGVSATTVGVMSAGTWYHCCVQIYKTTTLMNIICALSYMGLDEVIHTELVNTSVAQKTPAGLNATDIGQLAGVQFANGSIAEVAIWTGSGSAPADGTDYMSPLSALNIASLASGVVPPMIGAKTTRTQNPGYDGDLIAWWPLLGGASPEKPRFGTTETMALVNAPTNTTHPAMLYMSSRSPRLGVPTPPLGAVTLPASTAWKIQRIDLRPRAEGR